MQMIFIFIYVINRWEIPRETNDNVWLVVAFGIEFWLILYTIKGMNKTIVGLKINMPEGSVQ